MTKKTTRTRAEAKKLMWEYYRDNKDWLPDWIRAFREEILNQLLRSHDVHLAFEKCANRSKEQTPKPLSRSGTELADKTCGPTLRTKSI